MLSRLLGWNSKESQKNRRLAVLRRKNNDYRRASVAMINVASKVKDKNERSKALADAKYFIIKGKRRRK